MPNGGESAEVVPLQVFIERIILEMDRRYEQRFEASQRENAASLLAAREALQAALTASEKAVTKSEESSTQRLDAHNQLQSKLDRQAATFSEKDWVNDKLNTITDRIMVIEKRVAKFEDREAGMSLTAKLIIGVVSFAATLIAIYFTLRRG